MKAVYAGSFDPITLGHLDIIKRASLISDNLIVAILENPNKKCLFTIEERKKHLELVTSNIKNVEVDLFKGLLTDYINKKDIDVIIRGLRNAVDFAYEQQMQLINNKLNDNVETIFLAADEKHISLSSSAVKEVAIFGGNIDFMVPKEIINFVEQKYINKRGV